MFYKHLKYRKIERVVVINILGHLGDQEKLTSLANELNDFCTDVIGDREFRVFVLEGIGENVRPVGIDLPESISEDTNRAVLSSCSLSGPLKKLDIPMIAAISGDAIGLGLELALACDIRIASDTSCFGLPQIETGLIPWDGGTQRLSRLVGKGKALEMILTGEMIDAQEAYRIGLVNKIVPPDKLMTAAMDLAQEMASKGPIALRYAKEAIYKGMDMTLDQGIRLEADLYLLLHTTTDRTEGIHAFREKRAPKFEGK